MSIYEDYAKLRKDIGKLQKSGENPHFKNTYVELNTALEEIDKPLEKHNFICFIQVPITIDGKNYLNTKLIHSSKEVIEGNLELITTKQDPQMLGSSLTYARRYSLITMLGLQAVDDDGNEASGHTPPKKQETKPPVKTEAKKWTKPTPQQELHQLALDKKNTNIIWSEVLKSYNVSKISELSDEQVQEIKGDYKL